MTTGRGYDDVRPHRLTFTSDAVAEAGFAIFQENTYIHIFA
jgi:hypothetical protein